MNPRPLIVDKRVVADVARLKAYAQAHPLNAHDLFRAVGKPERGIGNDPNFRLIIPVGFRVVYSLEEQPKLGLCHHLSVSVNELGKYPNEFAVLEIARLFGLPLKTVEDLKDGKLCHVWLEDEVQAVNVLAPLKVD